MYIITYYKNDRLAFRAERGILEVYRTIKSIGSVFKIFDREDGITGRQFLRDYNSLTEPMLLVMTTKVPDEDQHDFVVIESSINDRVDTQPTLQEKDIILVTNPSEGMSKEEFLFIYGDRVMKMLEEQILIANQHMITLDRDMVSIKKNSGSILKNIKEKENNKMQRKWVRA